MKLARKIFLGFVTCFVASEIGFAEIFRKGVKIDSRYDQLWPFSITSCVRSQLHPIKLKSALKRILHNYVYDPNLGTYFGHQYMWIKGAAIAEKEPGTRFPQLHLSREHGVGVSVNSSFDAYWIAVDDYDLFMHGKVEKTRGFSKEDRQSLISKVKEKGYFKGLRLKDGFNEALAKERTEEEILIQQSVGTDFAIGVAATGYCVRIPVSEADIKRVINELNMQNKLFEKGETRFNSIFQNCSHAVNNAFAETGALPQKKISFNPLVTLWNLGSHATLPLNNVLKLAEKAFMIPLESPREIYRDDGLRHLIETKSWLPAAPGVSTYSTEAIVEGNELFDIRTSMYYMPKTDLNPLGRWKTYTRDLLFGTDDHQYALRRFLGRRQLAWFGPESFLQTYIWGQSQGVSHTMDLLDLDAHLQAYLTRYQTVKSILDSDRAARELSLKDKSGRPRPEDPFYLDFLSKYNAYIDQQIAATSKFLRQIESGQ